MRNAQNNLHVFSPVFFPLHGSKIIDGFNNALLRIQLKLVCRLIGIQRPILWVENLRAADTLDWFNSQLIVYHVSDLFTTSRYSGNRQKLEEREARIIAKSHLVICVSERLYNIKSARHTNVSYLPHGVDFELFREAAERRQSLDEIAHIKKPIAGYYGTLTANNDIELLAWCARRLPEVSFVLAGQITSGNYSQLSCLPNVHLIRKLPYEKIPALCASFDVCMLQWKMTEWIKCCNPLKLFEYMASGRPIVSVPIAEVEQKYSHIVSIARTKEEFCNAIVWELKNDTSERAALRIQCAEKHSWGMHVERISQLISAAIRAEQDKSVKASP